MKRRVAGAALVAAAIVALLAWYGTRSSDEPRTPVSVRVQPSVAEAARDAGVDLQAAVARAAADALELLPPSDVVRIEVRFGSEWAIPETGVGGYATPTTVRIEFERPFRPGSENWLPGLVAHELHHVIRGRHGPEPTGALAGALVMEGLADHFAREVLGSDPGTPWRRALTAAQMRELWRKARPILYRRNGYDHEDWFFGGNGIPRWGGYSLGYAVVAAYLEEEDTTASNAVDADQKAVLEAYVRRIKPA